MKSIPAFMIAVCGAAPACSDARPPEAGNPQPREMVMEESRSGEGVADLPWARGRVFHSLDEYLAYLEQQGAIDLPWWREVSPGVYEQVGIRVPGKAPERATRAELMRRYGFSR